MSPISLDVRLLAMTSRASFLRRFMPENVCSLGPIWFIVWNSV